ncbi:XRE family transcriptional regulator [Oceanicoccus sagamiensis]|uniref:Fis family transcriptional regulator n=1 Tax=Oceanicoccus sagamiensis TaxID=716816 RepID=A0A1X9N8F2_9GAMM|nr:XRE family transcriptional regulator [Oceanicoccus sagamiensis]ARN73364.1 Fis family transcriptional regulator [Oceanicoccus sagamiensis]
MSLKNQHIGSDFDHFLEEEGILAQAQAKAVAKVVAWELKKFQTEQSITKVALAKALQTSRSGLDRLLDPQDTKVTLSSLAKVAQVMGKRMEIRFI